MRTGTVQLLSSAGVTAAAFAWARVRRQNLRGKFVLVAGGSRGLGLVVARELARRGARLALLARSEPELARAREELASMGNVEVATVPCDLTEPADVQAAVALLTATLGPIDVVVDCAGEIEAAPFEAMTLSDFERMMDANFWSALHLAQAVLPEMRARGRGHLVHVSSIGGVIAVPHLLPYVASKFALTGLSLGLQAELAREGISVTTVCPGLMRTGSPTHALFKGDRAAEYGWFATSASLPLLSMSAERAARGIVRAIERRRGYVLLGWPALLAARAQAFAPDTFARTMELAAALLPSGAQRGEPTPGRASRSYRMPGWLTALSDRAAVRNNEEPPSQGAR